MILEHDAPQMAVAVRATYCEPDGATYETINRALKGRRQVLADAGVRRMAGHIRGDLTPFYPCAREDHKREQASTKEQAKRLIEEGIVSPRVIGKRIGVTTRQAKRLKAAVMSTRGVRVGNKYADS